MSTGNNIESEFLRVNSKNEWSAIYQKIRSESAKNSYSFAEALKPQNKNLNRYRDVSPYDHSRIILTRGTSDYINANLIRVQKANRKYILTQGPLANTVSHFWLMVWEQKSKAVLMLNKLVEKKQEKCYQYWPLKVGPNYIMTMEDVGLMLEYVEQQDHSYYLQRVLRLTDTTTQSSREILQFHYTTWPDFGVPGSPTAFLEFLRKVRDAGVLEDDVGPAVVHCSAGIGRSGTFCLVDSCLVLIEKFGLNSVDIKEILYEMRSYRMGLIQTPEQLRFSYQAIIEGAKQLDPNSAPVVRESAHLSDLSPRNPEDFVDELPKPPPIPPLNDSPTCKKRKIPCHQENHVSPPVIITNDRGDDDDAAASDSDEDPPPPPPRGASLKGQNGTHLDRPLPKIPRSESADEMRCLEVQEEYIPSRPLPVVPGVEEEEETSEDDLESPSTTSPYSEPVSNSDSLSPSELRQRKRVEQKERLEAQVRDMKRRQQANEQWTQLKRSLYKPLLIAGTIILGGGLVAYLYFKD